MVVIDTFRLEESRQVQNRGDASTPSDRRLMFERLTQARLDRAYRLAVAILRDPGEAEDAVQDAAMQAWDGWGRLRDESRFDAWVRPDPRQPMQGSTAPTRSSGRAG